MPGSMAMTTMTPDDMPSAWGVAGELTEEGFVSGAVNACLGHEEARGGGHDEGGDLGDEAVTHGQQGVGGGGVGEGHLHLRDTDDDTGNDIDEGDEQARDGVAADKLGGTIHGAVKGAFGFKLGAAVAGGFLVDETGGEIGVDGHLLAGHGVEGEAGSHFGDTARALGDDHEVHDHQDGEDDDADDEIALHHEIAERLDHRTGGMGAFVAVGEDEARGGKVERQPQHGGDQ